MNYNENIQTILKEQEITETTEIQSRSYQSIKDGASVIGLSPTGTGKTYAYGLPLIEKATPGDYQSIIILEPTNELAVQVRDALQPFAKAQGLQTMALVGSGNRKRQIENLKKKKPEIVIATLGRLFDMVTENKIKPEKATALVLDEADDLLVLDSIDMIGSFSDDMPEDSQILLFGATDSETTRNPEEVFGNAFILVDVRPDITKNNIHHRFLKVSNDNKLDVLTRLSSVDDFSAIVFFSSTDSLERVAQTMSHRSLKFGVLANKENKMQRQRAISDLQKGNIDAIFATDIASRGMDIKNLKYVVNYDLPKTQESYIHRAGRTGRMDAEGTVISMGNNHDFRDLKKQANLGDQLQKIYLVGHHLTIDKPFSKPKKEQEEQSTKEKNAYIEETRESLKTKVDKIPTESKQLKPKKKVKKNRKRQQKNKGYHGKKA
ncbi:DEAD/DEAH box helicase [Holzapfeliella floricola]|uniref:ATP-dependent RNA helicase n=1 Tax=Holzapfeliella floricola DSM 23037 = JCM 16512 TaxID=1423744 RepID=A0A0R2DW53_9LACO|nr:DEAD/DEAH box helicase [Holzapfeliella floricola]KRN04477.1 ATP-dependent RNA helicase [Holzapfeliella floricola DSM 23037 = JCM 16512]